MRDIEKLTKNFNKNEFDCKCGCGLNNINLYLVELLQDVRDAIKKPLIITSGCRCKKHNDAIGGVPFSEHTIGLAVDIKCDNLNERYIILPEILKRFNRIGIDKKFIHVGVDKFKDKNIIWVY